MMYYVGPCTCHCTVCYCHRRCPCCGIIDGHYTWYPYYQPVVYYPPVVRPCPYPNTISYTITAVKKLEKSRSDKDW